MGFNHRMAFRLLPVRTLALLLLVAAYLAIGPLVLVLGLLLVVPKVRRAVWPHWRHAGVLLAVVAMAATVVLVIPDGKLPIPPGGGIVVTSSYGGAAATPKPIDIEIAQHPGLADNGRSQMHVDGWSSDAYAGPGPLGKDPEIDTSWYGLKDDPRWGT